MTTRRLSRLLITMIVILTGVPTGEAAGVVLKLGDILVAEPDTASISVIDPATGVKTVISQGGLLPFEHKTVGVAFSPDGDVIVVHRTGGLIRVNPATGVQSVQSQGGHFRDPWAITIDRNTGYIYVADSGYDNDRPQINEAGKIIRVDPASGGQEIIASGSPCHLFPAGVACQNTTAAGSYLAHPYGIAIDYTSVPATLVVADMGSFNGQGAIIRIQPVPGGAQELVWGPASASPPPQVAQSSRLACPMGVAVEPNGNILTTAFTYPVPSTPTVPPPAGTYYGCAPPGIFRLDLTSNVQTVVNINAPRWVPDHTYAVGSVIHDQGLNYVHRVVTAGISQISTPAWSDTPGGTTADGSVVWQNIGLGANWLIPFGVAVEPAPTASDPSGYSIIVSDEGYSMVFRLDADGDFISAPLAMDIRDGPSVDVITVTPVGGFKVLPTLAFDGHTFSVNEAAGSATIALRRIGSLTASATALVSTGGGTAFPGTDYTPLTNKAVTFAAGAATATFPIAIVNDTLAAPNKTVGLHITDVGAGTVIGSPSAATLTIVNDDAPGTAQFSAPTYEITEGTASATITVTRTGGTASGVSVQYRVKDGDPGSATGGGVDYTLAPGTLSFGVNEISKTFTVAIVNDTIVDDDETVNLELINPTGGLTLGAQSTAVLTIHDNDAPTFRFGSATYTVAEGTALTVTVLRANGLGSSVSVDYAVQGSSTATGGQDYTLADGTVTFGVGITSQSIAIPTLQDTLAEGSEKIVLKLVNPSHGAVGVPDTATVTMTDNDTPGTMQFSAATYGVNENAGPATVRVTRAGANLASNVTVQFATTNGTGTAADYADATRILTFAAGEAFKDVPITIVDDAVAEGNETVVLTLSNPSPGATLGAIRTAVLTIRDDEQGLQFSAPVYVANEATPTVTIPVVRTGPAVGTVTVDYASAPASATLGADYINVSGTLTFGPGITSRTFTVPIINDTVFEAAESVAVRLSNAGGGARLGPLDTAIIRIADNDPPGAVRFSAATFTIAEGMAAATITVQRTAGATASAVTVDYATVPGGTATAGADYLMTSGTLTFNAGETSKTFTIPVLNDTHDEPGETLNLALSNPTGGATLGTPSTAILTITDNDVPGAITFGAPTYTVAEAAGVVLVAVSRTGGASGVTVQFTTADGSATAPADYTALSQTLSFGPGETRKILAIPIVDDGLREGDETVRLLLTNPTGGAALGAYPQAVLTITDNEIGATVQFGAATYTVAENVVGGVVKVTITRTGSTVPGQTVLFSASPETAVGGVDFVPISNQLVTFSGSQASVIVPITILNNTTIAGSRVVNLTLSSASPGLSLGVPRAATLTILEDDATVQFASASYAVTEGVAATLTVTRTGATLGTAMVSYATSPVTATSGTDYTAQTGTLIFGPGVTSQTIAVPTINDLLVEGPETFTVTLSGPSPATSISLGSPAVATVTINDNDAFGSLQLASTTYSVAEGAVASLIVTRTGGSAGAVTVQYATSNGSAGAPTAVETDYATVARTLTFLNGVTSQIISVPTKADTLLEGSETFTVTLSNPGGGATLGTPAAAVVTIVDDETPRLQFTTASSMVAESAGSVTLTVRRLGSTTTQNTVQYALAGLTATGGDDFVGTRGVLTFAAGVASRTIVVPVVGDTIGEGPETFTVTLSNPTGDAILGTPSVATVTISDDDPAGVVQFSQLDYTVAEGGTVAITVTRTGTAGPVAVSFVTSNGTATTHPDYTGTAGTLTFQAGETTKTFTVTTAADALTEGTESVRLTLSAPTNGLALGSMSTATLWVVE